MDTEIIKKEYEVAFLVKEEKDVEAVRRLMQSAGFEITQEADAKRMALPYKIQKETSAVFGFFKFSSEPEKIKSFSAEMTVNKECLRFMIIVNPPQKQEIRRRDELKEDKKPSDNKPEPEKEDRSLSNEDLEKKLEEILK